MQLPKKIDEDRLQLLKDRFVWLRLRLEETAHLIEAMGGTLPAVDEEFLDSLKEYKETIVNPWLSNNEWVGRVLDVLHYQTVPCTAKEISMILFEGQTTHNVSTIHIQVRNILPALLINGVIEVASTPGYKKYFLKQ